MSQQKDGRSQTRTRYPGIYKVTYPSGKVVYMVIVQIPGFRAVSKIHGFLDVDAWRLGPPDVGIFQ